MSLFAGGPCKPSFGLNGGRVRRSFSFPVIITVAYNSITIGIPRKDAVPAAFYQEKPHRKKAGSSIVIVILL